MPVLESGEETTLIGGQAVMEGVMMRAPHSYCVAVRRADGTIVTQEGELQKLSDQNSIWKLPILRGLGTLGQAMSLGMKALRFSADAALAGEQQGEGQAEKKVPAWAMWGQVAFSLIFAFVLYKWVPLQLTTWLAGYFPALNGQVANAAVDGVIRILIFLGFLFFLSRMQDIRRVFEYHGAEHRVVFNFESGQPVNVTNAQRFVTWHPRCGTSFMFVVFLLSMLVYMAIPVQGYWAKLGLRLALLPVITGLSYELIRFVAKRQANALAVLTAPGLWLQRITTQPPADDQTDVAVRALEGAMQLEERQGGRLVIA